MLTKNRNKKSFLHAAAVNWHGYNYDGLHTHTIFLMINWRSFVKVLIHLNSHHENGKIN